MRKSLVFTTALGLITTFLVLESCQKEDPVKSKVGQLPNLFPETASEYAALIESELGVVPTVVLDSMVEIPLYQNGIQVYGVFSNNNTIDNPTRLGKSTISGSAIQRYEGRTSDGTPLPNVVWVAFLRNATESFSSPQGSLQIIGYHQISGATAFFESSDLVSLYATSAEPITLKLSGVMPGPNNTAAFNQAYRTPPSDFQCISCHQADPFITNPFITAAKIPGTDEPVIPILGAGAPYHVIGGENWDMRTIKIEGNACMSCHRVGLATVRLFQDNGYNVNTHMPPDNPGSLSDDYLELMNAWMNGPENTANAEWIIPPAKGEPEQVVGTDYPFKAPFNNY